MIDDLDERGVLDLTKVLALGEMGRKRQAYDALPAGGALLVFEAIIDDERSSNA